MEKYFTINDTIIKLENDSVKKTYILKSIPIEETGKVSNLILDYYLDLKNAGISIPKLISKKKLTFNFTYCGVSLLEFLKKKNLSFSFVEDLFNQIEIILKNCIKNKIGLDPHIKNFTLLNDKVFYVDTFPPVSKEYINLLTKHNLEYSKDIKSHLKNYKPEKLAYHFLADLKKTKEINIYFYKVAKNRLLKKGFIRNFDVKKVNEIIKIENSNALKKGFSLS